MARICRIHQNLQVEEIDRRRKTWSEHLGEKLMPLTVDSWVMLEGCAIRRDVGQLTNKELAQGWTSPGNHETGSRQGCVEFGFVYICCYDW